MKKAPEKVQEDDLQMEYDLTKVNGRVRDKYAKRFREGTNLVLLRNSVTAAALPRRIPD